MYSIIYPIKLSQIKAMSICEEHLEIKDIIVEK